MDVQTTIRPDVRRPSNATRRLVDIDSRIATKISRTLRSERTQLELSAEVIVAGAQMAAIMRADGDAWADFARAHSSCCKGSNREYREIATVLWRSLKSSPTKRERISQYGKAIHIAARFNETNPAKLLKRVIDAGGVRGLNRLYSAKHKKPQPKAIRIPLPGRPYVYVIWPNGDYLPVEGDLASPVLSGVLQ